jgi:Bifunctional DNA primase/polymerase, N-terminal
VFPCKPGRKEPNTVHGFKDATTDPERIRSWWSRHPDDNVAIATGAPAPDVVDVDVKADGNGYQALERLRRAGLLVGAIGIVRTPSGGAHIYYPGTENPCRALRRHHLDFRGRGGYVVAPPSRVGGRCYQLVEERPDGRPVDFAAIAALLDPPRQPPRRPARQDAADGEIPAVVRQALQRRTDDRSRDLFRLVGACLWAGLATNTIHELAASYPPATDKYGGRLPTEVDRCIRRIGDAA